MEDHIVEGHEFTYEDCNAIFGDDSHFEYHKYKHHESSLKPPAITANDKKLRDEALTDSCMGQNQEGAMLEECKDDDDNSNEDMTDSEEVFPCRRCDQIFNSSDKLMFHIRL